MSDSWGPAEALSREDLVRVLKHAKARGLKTVLMPQINFVHPRGNEWRGKIQPYDWSAWWQQYDRMIREHLAIANEADVDVFVVGCELLTQTADHEAHWRDVIDMARQHFNGALTYSTNWDSYTKVRFWDGLDAIGISGYWDLTTSAKDAAAPTDAELRSAGRRFARTR